MFFPVRDDNPTLDASVATLALIGLPLVAYILFGEGLALVFRRLWDPWGLVAGAVVCLAWYVPAEWRILAS